jgi:acetylornithine/N-succinyldiaminopimelate aminotransferase
LRPSAKNGGGLRPAHQAGAVFSGVFFQGVFTLSKFEEIKSAVDKYVMNTYARFDIAIASGKGATAKDADGRTYIDFGSGIGVNALGFCDDGWVKAISSQAATLTHVSNLYYNSLQGELGKLLCGLTGMGRVFYANSGAEANEGLFKLARKYSFDKYGKGRSTIVSLINSFHGRTVTTLAATGQEIFHNYFFPFTEGFKYVEAGSVKGLEEALTGDVCAIILEAVQGEGGICPLGKDFVAAASSLAKEKDVLLLFDEVQAGVGRTGKLYAYEHFGVTPDAFSTSKALAGGLPMGAFLCTERLSDVLGSGTHASTFGGGPIVCAGAIEILSRVSKPEFLKEVGEKGEYLKAGLARIKGVGEIRGLGLMIGAELVGAQAKDVAAKACENGLLILTAKTALRLLPPLVITKEEIDKGLAILEKTISDSVKGG